MSRWRRRLAILGILVVVALVALRFYLRSAALTRVVEVEIGAALDTVASIQALQATVVGQTVVHGLKLSEAGDDRPYLEAKRVVVDLALAQAVAGSRMPDTIDLHDARLRLRFNRNGALLTKLPRIPEGGKLPHLRLIGLELTLEQEGRAPFTLQGASLTLDPQRLDNLSGFLEDPSWGKFDIVGRFGHGKLHLHLKNDRLPLTPALFRSVPFLPPALTRQAEFEGIIPLELSLWFSPEPPRARYQVSFDRARVRLLQPDRPAFVAFPARGALEGSDDGFQLKGDIRDPYWGNWTLAADLDSPRSAVMLHLDAKDVSVDPAKLTALPYVPKNVWRHVQASGRTPVKVRVKLFTDRPEVRYRVELVPRATKVRIDVLDLEAVDAGGEVIIEDNLVLLRDVKGVTAGGWIATTGELDFRVSPSRLRFDLDIKGLRLKEMPEKWELPRQLDGRVTGSAKLTVTAHPDRAETHGTGAGRIDEAQLAGFRTTGPIPLSLQADGKRIRFLPRLPFLEAIRSAGLVREREATYLDTGFSLEDVDLEELLRRFGQKSPVEITGRLSLRVRLEVPVNHLDDLRQYRMQGRVRITEMRLGGARIGQVDARVDLDRGVLRIDPLDGEKGRFFGTVRVTFLSKDGTSGKVSCNLGLNACRLDSVAGVLPMRMQPVSGRVTVRLRAEAALARWRDPTAWRGQVAFRAPIVEAAGVPFRDVEGVGGMRDGRVHLTELRAEALGGVLSGTLALSLANERIQGTIRTRGIDPATLPGVQGSFVPTGAADLSGEFTGQLRPWQLNAEGTVRASSLRSWPGRAEEVSGTWRLEGDQLELKEVRGRLHGGSVTGWGRLEFADRAGQFELFVSRLDAGNLAEVLAQSSSRVEGKLNGQASGSFRFVDGEPRSSFQLDLSSSRLVLQGVPADDLRGQLDFTAGKFRYRLTGETLAGQLTIEGTYPPSPDSASRPHGRLRLESAQLARLWEGLGLTGWLSELRGVVGINLPYRHDGSGLTPVGRGRFEVRGLRWREEEVMDLFRGDLRIGTDGISLRDSGGLFAGGSLRISGGARFDDLSRGWFDVRLRGAETNRFPMLAREWKGLVQGPIDVRLRGSLGPEWRGSGSVSLPRAKVVGVEVSEWRVPIDFSWTPATGQVEVSVRESSAQLGSGRAQLRASLRRTEGWRVEGQLLFFDAAVRSLAGMVGEVTSFARGRVNGRIDFTGAEMRSLTDFHANVQAKLNDVQALQLPVLRLIVPHVLPGQGALEFQAGELRGRLAGGVFRISELTLDSNVLLLLLQGSVTVQGRLDLDVTAQTTSPGINPLLLRVILQRLPPVGPVPVGLIIRVTDLLAERVVALRIAGSFRAPRVQVEPIRQLSEQAVRYFLSRAVDAAVRP